MAIGIPSSDGRPLVVDVSMGMLCEALAGDERGAVPLVASPAPDPVPGFRDLAGEVRLPGDRCPPIKVAAGSATATQPIHSCLTGR